MKQGRVNATYEESYIKKTRTFPVGKTVLLIVILLIQIGIIVAAFHFEPQPQDRIHQYDVTVGTKDDGSLDISYHLVWEALDTSEELTWIEIGMANGNYSVYPESVSDTIRYYTQEYYDGEVHLRLDLDRPYIGGEMLEFSFKINLKDMLCKDADGYFYEFIPCWFNSTPVESYSFRWAEDGRIQSVSASKRQAGFFVWSGSLECGEYVPMTVRYGKDSFNGCATVNYQPFDDDGAYNSLNEDKTAIIVLAFLGAAFLIIFQVWVVDSVVSYHRGRGFLTGHGFHIHAYGRSNPYYIRAVNRYNATHSHSSGHHRSGGCACACAGGGRAGCSQKDTYGKKQISWEQP